MQGDDKDTEEKREKSPPVEQIAENANKEKENEKAKVDEIGKCN